MDDFDKQFSRHFSGVMTQVDRGQKIALAVLVGWVLFLIGAATTIICVAWHFISKYW